MGRKVNLIDVIKYCEIRFGRGEANNWTHSDFIDLNKDILLNTKVNISVNTLKRIFGKLPVDNKYIPQEATIEALQKYSENVFPNYDQIPVEVQLVNKKNSSVAKSNVLIYIILLAIIGITGFFVWKFLRSNETLSAKIQLKKIEGISPSTAIFDMIIPTSNDSIFVDFGDKSQLIYVRAGQKRIAHNYLFADVFNISLKTRLSILTSTKITINSNKWIGLSFLDQRELSRRYFSTPILKTASDSFFNFNNSQLSKMGLDTAQRIFTRLYNYTPINYLDEDFIFETVFKNPLRKNGISCNSTQFQITGINGIIRFKLASPGCSSKIINVLSEQRFDGDKDDLSQFVLEQENWNKVKLINRNKNVSLFVNGKLLYKGSYQKSLGEIKGLFIEFEGNGFVKTCNLTAKNGRNLYHF